MPRTLTDAERDEFLAESRPAVLSIAADDGRPPLTVPVWYAYHDGRFTFLTGTQGRPTRKTRLLARAKALSLCVQREEFPYRYVTAECSLVKTDRSPTVEEVVAIIGRYLPADAAQAMAEQEIGDTAGTFVVFTARPDRWITVDFAEEERD
ncbi:pyridoxamine 5'-phosphate oxidase family protein [Amycolatopsis sp. YIM 10]|uniref:pyridoxamine 5'-phosphate oxidase family protein n=1 Tax=Amycolatopsis sp. YIM 10 TaxID=2653857 RepID=UPI00128FD4A2|nr:pyridoxamine 5'-phosphate oxidase family protein [Amycolatopsis sp. YIM 10]QFU92442.1 Pyridoxamine 5'-phosphate oxidase [Amycolatopsis sp. YIM 10]